MQVHLASLALGCVLVAGGLLLASGESTTRSAQAGITTDMNG